MNSAALHILVWVLALIRRRHGHGVAIADSAPPNAVTFQKDKLYLLTLLPYPDTKPTLQPSWPEGPNILPAIELAAEHVNNRTDILAQYKLDLINNDSGCDVDTKAYLSFVRSIYENKSIVGMIGPSCSTSSIVISQLTGNDEVALINLHLGGSLLLGNRMQYPYSLGMLSSSYRFVETAYGLMLRNGWKNVAALHDPTSVFFQSTFSAFEENIPSTSEISFSSYVSDTYLPLREIRQTLVRVVFVFVSPEYARRIACLAYHQNLFYPAYQWIMMGRTLSDFGDIAFRYEGTVLNCTRDMLVNVALRKSILVNYKLLAEDPNATTVSGFTSAEYRRMYEQRVLEHNSMHPSGLTLMPTDWGAPLYDAVWAVALAMNKSLQTLEEGNLSLANYRRGNPQTTYRILNETYSLDFKGVSGQINFDPNSGFGGRLIDIHQVVGGSVEHVANSINGNITIFGAVDFVEGSFAERAITVELPLAIVFLVVIIVLLLTVSVTHAVSTIYHKHRSIKASSPKLNHLIYVGCYFLAAFTILYITIKAFRMSDTTVGIVCHVQWAWLLPIGYTLIFGTIIARTWRLYRIFIHYLDPGSFISTPALFGIVTIFLFIDLVIGVVWTAIDVFHIETVAFESIQEDLGLTIELDRLCTTRYSRFVWTVLTVGYQMCLLVIMTTLALLTRTIRSKDFATTSLLVLSYLLALIFGLGVPTYQILLLNLVNINVDFTVLCVILVATISLTHLLVLLPPVVPLLREKYTEI